MPAVLDNGTQSASMYFGIYHGKNPSKPVGGDEVKSCTFWLSEYNSWDTYNCIVQDPTNMNVRDMFHGGTLVSTYCDVLGGSCVAPATTTRFDRYSEIFNG